MDSIRTCCICKNKRQKENLFRIAIINDEIVFDIKHTLENYGYYICKDNQKCMELSQTLLKRKKLNKLWVQIPFPSGKGGYLATSTEGAWTCYTPASISELNNTKITTLLRFAKKANKVVLGFDAVAKQLQHRKDTIYGVRDRKNKVCLLLLASDLAQGTAEKIRKIAQGTEVIVWADMPTYEDIVGKYTGIVGITDENFKKGIIDAIRDDG